jgi:hypothetical protein
LNIGANFPNLPPAYILANIGVEELEVMANLLKPKVKHGRRN